jgi:hypothetical protein
MTNLYIFTDFIAIYFELAENNKCVAGLCRSEALELVLVFLV